MGRRAETSKIGRVGGWGALARSACLLAAASGLAGCLVSEPPGSVEPDRERPNLHVFDAEPRTSEVVLIESGVTTIFFRVPVDLAPSTQPYTWQLWLNFDREGERILLSKSLDADAEEISYDWKPARGFATGCQQITMLAANSASLGSDFDPTQPPAILERQDIAVVSWWLNVDPAPGDELTLLDCPGPKDLPNP